MTRSEDPDSRVEEEALLPSASFALRVDLSSLRSRNLSDTDRSTLAMAFDIVYFRPLMTVKDGLRLPSSAS